MSRPRMDSFDYMSDTESFSFVGQQSMEFYAESDADTTFSGRRPSMDRRGSRELALLTRDGLSPESSSVTAAKSQPKKARSIIEASTPQNPRRHSSQQAQGAALIPETIAEDGEPLSGELSNIPSQMPSMQPTPRGSGTQSGTTTTDVSPNSSRPDSAASLDSDTSFSASVLHKSSMPIPPSEPPPLFESGEMRIEMRKDIPDDFALGSFGRSDESGQSSKSKDVPKLIVETDLPSKGAFMDDDGGDDYGDDGISPRARLRKAFPSISAATPTMGSNRIGPQDPHAVEDEDEDDFDESKFDGRDSFGDASLLAAKLRSFVFEKPSTRPRAGLRRKSMVAGVGPNIFGSHSPMTPSKPVLKPTISVPTVHETPKEVAHGATRTSRAIDRPPSVALETKQAWSSISEFVKQIGHVRREDELEERTTGEQKRFSTRDLLKRAASRAIAAEAKSSDSDEDTSDKLAELRQSRRLQDLKHKMEEVEETFLAHEARLQQPSLTVVDPNVERIDIIEEAEKANSMGGWKLLSAVVSRFSEQVSQSQLPDPRASKPGSRAGSRASSPQPSPGGTVIERGLTVIGEDGATELSEIPILPTHQVDGPTLKRPKSTLPSARQSVSELITSQIERDQTTWHEFFNQVGLFKTNVTGPRQIGSLNEYLTKYRQGKEGQGFLQREVDRLQLKSDYDTAIRQIYATTPWDLVIGKHRDGTAANLVGSFGEGQDDEEDPNTLTFDSIDDEQLVDVDEAVLFVYILFAVADVNQAFAKLFFELSEDDFAHYLLSESVFFRRTLRLALFPSLNGTYEDADFDGADIVPGMGLADLSRAAGDQLLQRVTKSSDFVFFCQELNILVQDPDKFSEKLFEGEVAAWRDLTHMAIKMAAKQRKNKRQLRSTLAMLLPVLKLATVPDYHDADYQSLFDTIVELNLSDLRRKSRHGAAFEEVFGDDVMDLLAEIPISVPINAPILLRISDTLLELGRFPIVDSFQISNESYREARRNLLDNLSPTDATFYGRFADFLNGFYDKYYGSAINAQSVLELPPFFGWACYLLASFHFDAERFETAANFALQALSFYLQYLFELINESDAIKEQIPALSLEDQARANTELEHLDIQCRHLHQFALETWNTLLGLFMLTHSETAIYERLRFIATSVVGSSVGYLEGGLVNSNEDGEPAVWDWDNIIKLIPISEPLCKRIQAQFAELHLKRPIQHITKQVQLLERALATFYQIPIDDIDGNPFEMLPTLLEDLRNTEDIDVDESDFKTTIDLLAQICEVNRSWAQALCQEGNFLRARQVMLDTMETAKVLNSNSLYAYHWSALTQICILLSKRTRYYLEKISDERRRIPTKVDDEADEAAIELDRNIFINTNLTLIQKRLAQRTNLHDDHSRFCDFHKAFEYLLDCYHRRPSGCHLIRSVYPQFAKIRNARRFIAENGQDHTHAIYPLFAEVQKYPTSMRKFFYESVFAEFWFEKQAKLDFAYIQKLQQLEVEMAGGGEYHDTRESDQFIPDENIRFYDTDSTSHDELDALDHIHIRRTATTTASSLPEEGIQPMIAAGKPAIPAIKVDSSTFAGTPRISGIGTPRSARSIPFGTPRDSAPLSARLKVSIPSQNFGTVDTGTTPIARFAQMQRQRTTSLQATFSPETVDDSPQLKELICTMSQQLSTLQGVPTLTHEVPKIAQLATKTMPHDHDCALEPHGSAMDSPRVSKRVPEGTRASSHSRRRPIRSRAGEKPKPIAIVPKDQQRVRQPSLMLPAGTSIADLQGRRGSIFSSAQMSAVSPYMSTQHSAATTAAHSMVEGFTPKVSSKSFTQSSIHDGSDPFFKPDTSFTLYDDERPQTGISEDQLPAANYDQPTEEGVASPFYDSEAGYDVPFDQLMLANGNDVALPDQGITPDDILAVMDNHPLFLYSCYDLAKLYKESKLSKEAKALLLECTDYSLVLLPENDLLFELIWSEINDICTVTENPYEYLTFLHNSLIHYAEDFALPHDHSLLLVIQGLIAKLQGDHIAHIRYFYNLHYSRDVTNRVIPQRLFSLNNEYAQTFIQYGALEDAANTLCNSLKLYQSMAREKHPQIVMTEQDVDANWLECWYRYADIQVQRALSDEATSSSSSSSSAANRWDPKTSKLVDAINILESILSLRPRFMDIQDTKSSAVFKLLVEHVEAHARSISEGRVPLESRAFKTIYSHWRQIDQRLKASGIILTVDVISPLKNRSLFQAFNAVLQQYPHYPMVLQFLIDYHMSAQSPQRALQHCRELLTVFSVIGVPVEDYVQLWDITKECFMMQRRGRRDLILFIENELQTRETILPVHHFFIRHLTDDLNSQREKGKRFEKRFVLTGYYSAYLIVALALIFFLPPLTTVFSFWNESTSWTYWLTWSVEFGLLGGSLYLVDWPALPAESDRARVLALRTRTQNLTESCLMIACHRSADIIEETIRHALAVFPPHHIFVCDNANSETPLDHTEQVLERLSRSWCKQNSVAYSKEKGVQYHWIPEGNKTVAFWYVVKYMLPEHFKYILMTDDDVMLPPDLALPVHKFEDGQTKAMAFTIRAANLFDERGRRCLVAHYQDLEYKLAGFNKLFQSSLGSAMSAHGAIAMWEKNTLLQVFNHHNTTFHGEDLQMGLLGLSLSTNNNFDYRMDCIGTVCVPTTVPDHVMCRKLLWCRCPEASLLKQRVRSWDCAGHRFIPRLLYLLLFYWRRNILILKPFMLYEIWTDIMDWMRLVLISYLLWINPLSFFVGLLSLYSVYVMFMFLFNYWTLRNRPDLQSPFYVIVTFPFYRYMILFFRIMGLIYNVAYYVPFHRNRRKIKDRNDLPFSPEEKDYLAERNRKLKAEAEQIQRELLQQMYDESQNRSGLTDPDEVLDTEVGMLSDTLNLRNPLRELKLAIDDVRFAVEAEFKLDVNSAISMLPHLADSWFSGIILPLIRSDDQPFLPPTFMCQDGSLSICERFYGETDEQSSNITILLNLLCAHANLGRLLGSDFEGAHKILIWLCVEHLVQNKTVEREVKNAISVVNNSKGIDSRLLIDFLINICAPALEEIAPNAAPDFCEQIIMAIPAISHQGQEVLNCAPVRIDPEHEGLNIEPQNGPFLGEYNVETLRTLSLIVPLQPLTRDFVETRSCMYGTVTFIPNQQIVLINVPTIMKPTACLAVCHMLAELEPTLFLRRSEVHLMHGCPSELVSWERIEQAATSVYESLANQQCQFDQPSVFDPMVLQINTHLPQRSKGGRRQSFIAGADGQLQVQARKVFRDSVTLVDRRDSFKSDPTSAGSEFVDQAANRRDSFVSVPSSAPDVDSDLELVVPGGLLSETTIERDEDFEIPVLADREECWDYHQPTSDGLWLLPVLDILQSPIVVLNARSPLVGGHLLMRRSFNLKSNPSIGKLVFYRANVDDSHEEFIPLFTKEGSQTYIRVRGLFGLLRRLSDI